MLTIFIRLLIIYAILLFSMRLLGKRQIGELEISELITTILLSELAALPVTHPDIPLLYAVIPVLLLVSLEVIISFLVTRSRFLKKLLYSRPSFLIRHGKLDQKEMSRVRLSMEEFLSELRLKDIASPAEVDYAILEPNGQLSVFPKAPEQPAKLKDLALSSSDGTLSHPLIIDGVIDSDALRHANRTETWLLNTVKEKKLHLPDIFLYAIDDAGSELLIKKEDCKK